MIPTHTHTYILRGGLGVLWQQLLYCLISKHTHTHTYTSQHTCLLFLYRQKKDRRDWKFFYNLLKNWYIWCRLKARFYYICLYMNSEHFSWFQQKDIWPSVFLFPLFFVLWKHNKNTKLTCTHVSLLLPQYIYMDFIVSLLLQHICYFSIVLVQYSISTYSVMFTCALVSLSGFDWSLHFKWEQLSPEQRARRTDPTQPIK